MLYNKDKQRINGNTDCLTCKHFDNGTFKCNGLGITCFEYDELTDTLIDPFTNLPLKNIKKEEKEK